MRVRPIFWCILALACAGVLTFASIFHPPVPSIMQVHVAQALPAASGFETKLDLHLSDPQGSPIDHARIMPDAHMTNMQMRADSIQVFTQGDGNYRIVISLIMAGPWAIHITASADGFDSQQQNLFIMVS
ncbi:MAG: FixH family protein [Chloroflexota bacterium]|nr:FixH family protein [Chloroflexota bacterium]